MGLKVCALCATEIKQDKERAATVSRLCSLCVSKKKWDRERVGMGSGLCNLWDFQCSQIRKSQMVRNEHHLDNWMSALCCLC